MNVPILLGHNDALLRLERSGDHLAFLFGDDGNLDLPRAREGGVVGGFFACWVPGADEESPVAGEEARDVVGSMMETMYALERDSGGEIKLVRSLHDLRTCLDEDLFALILHFEGAEAILPDLSNLERLHAHGLRSLGPVWSRPNAFGEGVPFRFPSSPDTGPGLTWAGEDLVRACNQLGIMLDVSHLNEEGFWDLARLTRKPIVATHSNAFALCPSSRNLTDDQLRAVAASNGVVGINFYVADLRPDGEEDSDTPMEYVFRHIEYIRDLVGIDHVAIGTDFDGATMPDQLSDARDLPELMGGLAERGFSEEELAKIGYQNWLRVLEETWED
jgi:membrane dipeptidase